MRFDFMSGRSTNSAIFIVRHLQEKFYAANNTQYKAFGHETRYTSEVRQKPLRCLLSGVGTN